jgi:hypothetical protein
MLGKLALRDLVILTLAASIYGLLAPLSAGTGMLGDVTGVVAGLAIGISAFLLHEWGHLLGALASRSDVRLPERLGSVYLFSYDSQRNDRRQFLVMSLSGFAVTGIAVWAVYAVLPDGQLATRVARGAVLFLAFLTVVLEFPLVLWSLARSTIPPVEVFRKHKDEPRTAV